MKPDSSLTQVTKLYTEGSDFLSSPTGVLEFCYNRFKNGSKKFWLFLENGGKKTL